MKIGIIGTRGIPNKYGGFEECAQQLGTRLVEKGHEVVVYNSHRHPYQEKSFEEVAIVHKYDPEHRIGTFGQFIYDLNCILDARWHNFDILLMLGYTSSSIWQRLLPKKPLVITNMDGLEWKRSKYSGRVRRFLKRAERWAAAGSHLLIADNPRIEDYLNEAYSNDVVYIPYGAEIPEKPDQSLLAAYGIEPRTYNLIIARLEPENNLEIMLSGITKTSTRQITLVIGNHNTAYGEYLKQKFTDSRIRFIQSNFDKKTLNSLRFYSHIYLHGHSVGGTNPSLLEAMACSCLILSHDNPFNRAVLGEDANYFLDQADVSNAVEQLERSEIQKERIKKNLNKVRERFNWDLIADQYELAMRQALIAR